jgi:hypothetical protein
MPNDKILAIVAECEERMKAAEAAAYEARSDAVCTILDGAAHLEVVGVPEAHCGPMTHDAFEDDRKFGVKVVADKFGTGYAATPFQGCDGHQILQALDMKIAPPFPAGLLQQPMKDDG